MGGPWNDLGASVGRMGVGERELDDRSIVHVMGDDVKLAWVATRLESFDSEGALPVVDRDGQRLVVTNSLEKLGSQDIGWADVIDAFDQFSS